ncbi:MAG TPA: DinB family protein [Acidimicrobiia bacterium]|nr:DinB family protein [Acidimicrobiia bacterium]
MDVLLEFFRHNSMMNRTLLDTCRGLTPGQLASTTEGTYGSIAATLVHIANAQAGYAARLLNVERPTRLPEDPFPGFPVLAERLSIGDGQLEEATGRNDWDRQVQITGDDPPGTWLMPVGLFLLQAINHGTEHRSQIATILSQLGIEPPAMDGWGYILETDYLIEVEPQR